MTMAATAATISSTEVASNGKKYLLNKTRASARTFPPRLTATNGPAARVESPTPSLTAKNTSAASPKPRSTASGRWAFIRSTRLSSDATPSSMITKRKRTMMAPA